MNELKQYLGNGGNFLGVLLKLTGVKFNLRTKGGTEFKGTITTIGDGIVLFKRNHRGEDTIIPIDNIDSVTEIAWEK